MQTCLSCTQHMTKTCERKRHSPRLRRALKPALLFTLRPFILVRRVVKIQRRGLPSHHDIVEGRIALHTDSGQIGVGTSFHRRDPWTPRTFYSACMHTYTWLLVGG